ncbi:unnamed protein product [Brassicogethes aeneus]|uniref:Uncharacterized protein n=1 Tax=Brassicogethes aeneus TaxID=1431903 RepID=A0A9P0B774_BRAAE|nr:unnamed protein product [Brassicogethes aeneus]
MLSNHQLAVALCVLALAAPHVSSEYSNGFKIFGKIVRQYIKSQPDDILIGEGVHLVNSKSADGEARALSDDGTIFSALENYLRSHELRIKLPELMPGEELGRSFKIAMDKVDKANENGTGRGKGGGGGGGGGGNGIAFVGMMGAKFMAALGIGGVGLLAMKALMVSALALLLATVVGLKKLVHHEGDEGGHHVIHASAHGHHEYRKKREAAADLAYNAWEGYKRR